MTYFASFAGHTGAMFLSLAMTMLIVGGISAAPI